MVQYAQQTDPNKAKASSIGEQITPTTQTTTTTPTETKTTTTPVVETKPVAETTLTSTQKRLEKLRPSGTTTTSQPITNNNQAPDWIGDFANNAKLIEKQSQQKALETSKRLATTSANVIATDYNNG